MTGREDMPRPNPIGRIPVILLASVVLMLVMLISTLMFASQKANQIAKDNSVTLISGGFEAEQSRLSGIVSDYAIWQAAYDAATARDTDWLYKNMASGAGFGQFDLLEIYWPEDDSNVSWGVEHGEAGQLSTLSVDAVQGAYKALNEQQDYDFATYSFVAEVNDSISLVAASRIEPDEYADDADPSSFPLTFMIFALTEEIVSDLGSQYLTPNLHLNDHVGDADIGIPLVGIDGTVLTNLVWAPPRPGAELVRAILPYLGVAISIILGFSLYVGRTASEAATELVKNEMNSAILARTDHLTGLHNRMAFHEQIKKTFANARDDIALMTVDVNGFKQVNDNYGHAVGDGLIIDLAERICDTQGDDIFFARVGGDEFCFLHEGKDAAERMSGFANSLKSALEPAFYINGSPFFVALSMGMAVRKIDEPTTQDELLRQADLAMYASKGTASHLLVRYDSEIDPSRIIEIEFETELRRALQNPEQFSMKYQPIICSNQKEISFAEALLRWESPKLGKVSPSDFIPVAESSGLIRQITALVLEMVCKDLSNAPDLTVSINVSPIEINDQGFHHQLSQKVQKYGVRPEQIIIELTEGVLVKNPRGLSASLQKLRLMGHQIALDDFGTGYSSIGYLRQMEFTLLKVDKSLIDGVTKSKRAREVLAATLQLSKAIGIQILAEGVESSAQASILEEMGFDMQQGFNFSGNLRFDDLVALAAAKRAA